MQLEPRLMKRVRQDSKDFLFDCQKVCTVKLITELRLLSNQSKHCEHLNTTLYLTQICSMSHLKVLQHLQQQVQPCFRNVPFCVPKRPYN